MEHLILIERPEGHQVHLLTEKGLREELWREACTLDESRETPTVGLVRERIIGTSTGRIIGLENSFEKQRTPRKEDTSQGGPSTYSITALLMLKGTLYDAGEGGLFETHSDENQVAGAISYASAYGDDIAYAYYPADPNALFLSDPDQLHLLNECTHLCELLTHSSKPVMRKVYLLGDGAFNYMQSPGKKEDGFMYSDLRNGISTTSTFTSCGFGDDGDNVWDIRRTTMGPNSIEVLSPSENFDLDQTIPLLGLYDLSQGSDPLLVARKQVNPSTGKTTYRIEDLFDEVYAESEHPLRFLHSSL